MTKKLEFLLCENPEDCPHKVYDIEREQTICLYVQLKKVYEEKQKPQVPPYSNLMIMLRDIHD